MKPVVGILCCGFDGKNQFVTDTYVRAVRISGGIPLLIPILPQDFPINSYLDICDGFLLPGGGDFTPFLFNEDPLPGVGQTNLSVDLFQIHFAEEILKRHLPVIGICRGMQVLNAACGGTVEAIEIEGQPFALGVQWHPESMFFTSPCMRELFSLFVRSMLPGTD